MGIKSNRHKKLILGIRLNAGIQFLRLKLAKKTINGTKSSGDPSIQYFVSWCIILRARGCTYPAYSCTNITPKAWSFPKNNPKKFYYKNRGYLATIGRSNAIVDLGWITLKGRMGWLFWSIIHIYFLIGFRNRLMVFINWIWNYVTFGKGARLITKDR